MLLRTKITGFCLAIGLLPLLCMGIYSVQTASNSLEEKAYQSLAAGRDVQKKAIADIIERWKHETVIYSKVKEVYNAVGMFRDYTYGMVEEGKPMALDDDYEGIYEFSYAAFEPFVKELGFADALLLDDYGRVVFSVKRESDLGQDFAHGVLKNTNLSRAWAKAVKGEVVMVDLEPYPPLDDRPVAFMAAPLKSYTGDILGVVALRLSFHQVNQIMSNTGDDSEIDSYLVGSDGLMRSDSARAPETHSVEASFAEPEAGSVTSEAVGRALAGETGFTIGTSFDGREYLTAYAPIVAGGMNWALVSEVPVDSAFSAVSNLRIAALVLGVVSALLIMMLTYVYLRRAIADPFRRIMAYVGEVSGGNLHSKPTGTFYGEIAQVVDGLESMVGQLKEKLGFAQGILDSMTVPCVVADKDNKVSFVNSYFLDMMEHQHKAEVFMGKPASSLLQHRHGEKGSTSRALSEQRAIFNVEREWTTEKGNNRNVRIDCAPLYDLDDQLIGAIALVTDLTDIRTKEAQISDQNWKMGEVAEHAEVIASNVSNEAEELAQLVSQVGEGARMQVEHLEQTASIIEAMNHELGEAAQFAEAAESDAKAAMRKAEEGTGVMGKTTDAMQRVQGLSDELKESMHQLGSQADAIGGILEVISDIADQTNLLALNAAIEAARAGDAGRGFAVVADEVRKLAERTMDATNEVNKSVKMIQDAARKNISNTDAAAAAIREGSDLVSESSSSLQEIVQLSISMGERIQRIAEVSRQHSEQHDNIISAFDDIRNIANETRSGMNDSEMSVSGLTGNAGELTDLIGKLRM